MMVSFEAHPGTPRRPQNSKGFYGVPFGKQPHSYGKSPLLIGKSVIPGPFSIAMFSLPEDTQADGWEYWESNVLSFQNTLQKKRSVVPQILSFWKMRKWNMSFWVSISWFPGPRNPLLSIFVPREHLRPQCLPPIIIKAGTMCSTLYIYIYKCEKLGLIKAPNSFIPVLSGNFGDNTKVN